MRRLMFAVGILVAALVGSAPSVWAQAPKAPAASRARATASAPVNLNSATAAQLQTLPGIGASTAQRILDYRQKNGARTHVLIAVALAVLAGSTLIVGYGNFMKAASSGIQDERFSR